MIAVVVVERMRGLLVLVGLMLGLAVVGLLAGASSALAAPPAFTQVAGSPFGPTGRAPVSVAFSPGGVLLATANNLANSVSVFSVGSGGALTPVAGSPFATGSFPRSVAFSPSGGLFATANGDADTVSVYGDSDLALTGVPGNITTDATGPAGAVVHYTPPTATDEDSGETPTVGCLPASGSTFAIGKTTVTCTATDPDGLNSPVTATFTVTVTGALGQLQALLGSAAALPSSTAKTPAERAARRRDRGRTVKQHQPRVHGPVRRDPVGSDGAVLPPAHIGSGHEHHQRGGPDRCGCRLQPALAQHPDNGSAGATIRVRRTQTGGQLVP